MAMINRRLLNRGLLLLFFCTIWLAGVQVSWAYEPGLLYGKSLTGDGTTKNLGYINDNDPSTSTNIYYNFSYTFTTPVNIRGLYINGDATSFDTLSRVEFIRPDGTIASTVYVRGKAGVLTSVSVNNVAKVMYRNGDGFFDYVSDFEVYETTVAAANDPTEVKATALSSSEIRFDWKNPDDEDFKAVEIYQGNTLLKTVPKPTETITIGGFSSNTSYTFVVKSLYEDARRSKGVTVTAKTLEGPPPPPPEITSISVSTTKTQIKVSWVGGVAPYTVKYGGETKTTTDTSVLLGGFSPGMVVTITVTDKNGSSKTVTVKTPEAGELDDPLMPTEDGTMQKMIDVFGTAGFYALIVIGAAVALGIIVIVAIYTWRLLKRWLRSAK